MVENETLKMLAVPLSNRSYALGQMSGFQMFYHINGLIFPGPAIIFHECLKIIRLGNSFVISLEEFRMGTQVSLLIAART